MRPFSASRPRPLAWRASAALVILLVLATATAEVDPTGAPVGIGEAATVPRVSDPVPAPGAVVPAGPVTIGARVRGADARDVRLLLDGERAVGRFVDPDGQLSGRRGVAVTLQPGRHEVAVEVVGHGVVRSWTIEASGLSIDVADTDPVALAVRMSGRRAASRPVVLVNAGAPGIAAAAASLSVALDALLLPTDPAGLTDRAWTALLDANLDEGETAILLGGSSVIGDAVATSLTHLGLVVVRIEGADAAEVASGVAAHLRGLTGSSAPAGWQADAFVVGPAVPADAAIRTSIAAASLGATALLATPTGLTDGAATLLSQGTTVLASEALTPIQVARLRQSLPGTAAVSGDRLEPRRAAEAIIVADGTDDGRVLLASRGSDPNRAVLLGSQAGRAWVARHRPDRVTLVGPEPAVAELAGLLHRDWVDGTGAPSVEVLVDDTDGLRVTLTAEADLAGADVHVDLLGYEWPGVTRVEGRTATWEGSPRPRLPEPLEPSSPATSARIDLTAVVDVVGGRRHVSAGSTARISPITSLSSDGFLVAGGSGPVVGAGPLRTFSVEVEATTGLDVDAVAAEVEQILLDPRSWTADGTRSLQRVGTDRAADLRVVVARPQTVDLYCGRVGLRTGGRVSCWDGYRAMLNLDRWNTGVVPFHTDIEVYRQYLVNHEFGHGLGYGHVFCPGVGALAPVMMQQTGGLGVCRANGWPYPTIGSTPATG